jgi:hypothetical protein
MPRVLYNTKYVSARPSIAFLLSSGVHLRPCTLRTRLCMSAMGSEFEFMNIEAAIAKFLEWFEINARATQNGQKRGDKE